MGFSTVTIPFGEVYNAFQRGICNTTEVPFDALEGMGFIEVTKFVIWTELYWQVLTPTMNIIKWGSLTPSQKKAFHNAWNKAGEWYNEQVFRQVEPMKKD